MSLYRQVFAQSLKLTWKNKYFWWLAIFTVFFSSSVEIDMFDNFFGPSRNYLYDYKTILDNNLVNGWFMNGLHAWIKTDPNSFWQMARFGLVFLILFIVLLLLSAAAQIIITGHSAFLIKNNSDTLKNHKHFSLVENLRKIKETVVSVSVLNLILKLVINVSLIVITLPMLINQNGGFTWLYVLLFLTMFPGAIIASFIIRFVACYIIVAGQNFKQAFLKGFNLFKNHWLVSVEMSLILFLINVFGSLLIIFIILAISNPLWFICILANQYLYKGAFYILLALTYLIFFLLFAWGAALLATINITAWTSLFLKLDKNTADSKIVRVVSGLIK